MATPPLELTLNPEKPAHEWPAAMEHFAQTYGAPHPNEALRPAYSKAVLHFAKQLQRAGLFV